MFTFYRILPFAYWIQLFMRLFGSKRCLSLIQNDIDARNRKIEFQYATFWFHSAVAFFSSSNMIRSSEKNWSLQDYQTKRIELHLRFLIISKPDRINLHPRLLNVLHLANNAFFSKLKKQFSVQLKLPLRSSLAVLVML